MNDNSIKNVLYYVTAHYLCSEFILCSKISCVFSPLGCQIHQMCHSVRNKKYFLSLFSTQICDKEWHYYVINVEFPAVTLFVDGVTYDPYLVTDDWPIHPSQIDVQLTVGACWQGDSNEDRQAYSGFNILFLSCYLFIYFC